MPQEEWRPVPDWPGYEVSDRGRIRSGRGVLAQHANRDGYMTVTLRAGRRRRTVAVHVIVAAAFLGPKPHGLQVRHLDGRQWRNAAANLAYGTQADQEADKKNSARRKSTRRVLARRQAEGRKLERTETVLTSAYASSRAGAPCHRSQTITLSPAQTPVSSQDETGPETGPATGCPAAAGWW